ncbi:MAG: DUF47 domain-containing protein [Armatimonadota bacterium]
MARFRLLPRDERFFDLFEQATDVIVAGAETLQRMLEDIGNAETYRKTIADLEHTGDSIIHDVIDKLNRTFVTPLDPEDIRLIASRLDDVIDFTQAAAERLVLYRVTEHNDDALALTKVLVQTTKEVQRVVKLLRTISERRQILDLCIEINRLENTGDRIYRESLGSLFSRGDVLELMRWKEIYEQIEQGIDECEDLADAIESIVVKHA